MSDPTAITGLLAWLQLRVRAELEKLDASAHVDESEVRAALTFCDEMHDGALVALLVEDDRATLRSMLADVRAAYLRQLRSN